MRATLEPVAYVLRLHPDPDARFGDPYTGAATVTVDDAGVATIRGAIPGPDVDRTAWRAVLSALAGAGCSAVAYSRRKGVTKHRITRPLKGHRT